MHIGKYFSSVLTEHRLDKIFICFQENPETAPLLLWLQGGPGGSSLFGLFVENGPYLVDKDIKCKLCYVSLSNL